MRLGCNELPLGEIPGILTGLGGVGWSLRCFPAAVEVCMGRLHLSTTSYLLLASFCTHPTLSVPRAVYFSATERGFGSGLRNSCTQMRRQWHPTPVLLPGKSHGQRSLVGCSPWDRQESDMTERLHFHFSLSCIGEGNGNTLQCSGLENPRDGGA